MLHSIAQDTLQGHQGLPCGHAVAHICFHLSSQKGRRLVGHNALLNAVRPTGKCAACHQFMNKKTSHTYLHQPPLACDLNLCAHHSVQHDLAHTLTRRAAFNQLNPVSHTSCTCQSVLQCSWPLLTADWTRHRLYPAASLVLSRIMLFILRPSSLERFKSLNQSINFQSIHKAVASSRWWTRSLWLLKATARSTV